MRTHAGRSVVVVVAVAVAFAAGAVACFAERRGLSRDALLGALEETKTETTLPSVADLVALRVPDPPPRPADVDSAKPKSAVERAHLELARGDIAKTEAAWGEALGKNANDVETLAHECIADSILRRYDDLIDVCPRFLAAAPSDARAPAAVRVLTKTAIAVRAAGVVVAKKGASWVAACAKARAQGAGQCADLAFLVANERAEQAKVDKDERGFDDAITATGRVRRAFVEGPYEGDVRSDFVRDAKNEPPHPQPTLFHTQRFVDEDGVLSPSLRGPDGFYRTRFVASSGAARKRATIYLASAHAARLRVDGVVVAERAVDAPNPAITRAAVELQPGLHNIELVAWSTGRGDDLAAAFLDDNGAPALFESSDNDTKLTGDVKGAGAKPVALAGAVDALAVPLGDTTANTAASAASTASSDIDALDKLLWRTPIARNPAFGVDPDEARQIASALVAQFGWSPAALAVAAELIGDDRSVPEKVASSSAARLWAKVRAAWPDHPVARIAEARDFKEERPDEALNAYRALVKAQPRYPFGQRELIDVALENGLVDEARASANALLAIDDGPENIDAAVPALRNAGELQRAEKLEDERATHDDNFASTRFARRLLEAGRTDEGLAALEKAAHAERGSQAIEEWINLLALRSPKDALVAVDRVLPDFPDDPSLHLVKAQLLAQTAGADAARDFLVKSLPHVRESDNAARYAEELGVPSLWHDRLALGDDVIAKRRALKDPPFAGYPAVALLDDAERDFFDDESSLSIRHLIIELRTKEILDRFGEFSLGDARIIRLRVIKPDGSVVERERHRGVEDVSLPQLGEGDIVELLTVEHDPPTRIGGSFETRELDGAPTPALSRRYILTFPEGFDDAHGLKLVAFNGLEVPPNTAFVDGEGRKRARYAFAVDNVPGVTNEPFAPSRIEIAKTGGYAWSVDPALWARLRGITVELSAQQTAWLRASAQKIAGAGDDVDKMRRIFAFVARKIEPADNPDDATAVLASAQGQRTPLLLALLRAAGLHADPVALQLPTQPDPQTLDLSSWSTVAVRVTVGDKEHYAVVDGNAVLDRLPPVAKGSKVLDLTLASSRAPEVAQANPIETLPDDVVDENPVRVQVDLALKPASKDVSDATLNGLIVVTIPASKADGARRGVRRATPDQLKNVVERAFASSLPGVSVVDVKTPDLDKSGDALRIGAHVSVPLPLSSDGAARFDHLFSDGASGGLGLTSSLASYLQVADRKAPLLVGADRELLEVQLTLPATAAFVEAPEPLSLVAGPFSLDQKVEIEDGKLYWRRAIDKQNARISVDTWPGVRVTLAGLAARSDARLSFVVSKGARGTTPSDTSGKRAQLDQNR